MPTVYTAGILNGSITNFNDYAKLCSRAFIVHLRDELLTGTHKERTPTDYHEKAIKKAQAKLKNITILSDKEILNEARYRLENDKKKHIEELKKGEINRKKMNLFLHEAKEYKPPTDKHNGIASFMVEQLVKTIEFDCDSDYHEKEIVKTNEKIKTLTAEKVRSELRIKATKDIAYHTEKHEEEVIRCTEHNTWYDDFIKSLTESI